MPKLVLQRCDSRSLLDRYPIYINRQQVGRLALGETWQTELPPGRHHLALGGLQVQEWQDMLELEHDHCYLLQRRAKVIGRAELTLTAVPAPLPALVLDKWKRLTWKAFLFKLLLSFGGLALFLYFTKTMDAPWEIGLAFALWLLFTFSVSVSVQGYLKSRSLSHPRA